MLCCWVDDVWELFLLQVCKAGSGDADIDGHVRELFQCEIRQAGPVETDVGQGDASVFEERQGHVEGGQRHDEIPGFPGNLQDVEIFADSNNDKQELYQFGPEDRKVLLL